MATARETAISNENIGLIHMIKDRLYLNPINALDMICQRDILCTGTIHIRDIIHVFLCYCVHIVYVYYNVNITVN